HRCRALRCPPITPSMLRLARLRMLAQLVPPAGLQRLDDALYVLGRVVRDDQHRVRGLDDHVSLYTDSRDEPSARRDEAIAARARDDIAADDVAVSVLVENLVERRP